MLPPELLENGPFVILRRICHLGVKEHERELIDRLIAVAYSLGKIDGARHMLACARAADAIKTAKTH